jgi:carboxylesterase type B
MGGHALSGYYSPSKAFAKRISGDFLKFAGLDQLDSTEVYDQLVHMPLEKIMNASASLFDIYGLTTFCPVIESEFPGVTRIVSDDPQNLIAEGYGNNITIVIGYTDAVTELFIPRLNELDTVNAYAHNPMMGLSLDLAYSLPENVTSGLAEKVRSRYFGCKPPCMDTFLELLTESYFAHPALRIVKLREQSKGAPVYLFKYSYQAEQNVFELAYNLTYTGAGYGDDLALLFKINSFPVPCSKKDKEISDWFIDLFVNFIKYK